MTKNLAHVLFAACLCLGASESKAQEKPEANCSVTVMRNTPQAAIDACSTLANSPDVAVLAKAEALKTRGRAFFSLDRLDAAAADFKLAALLNHHDPEIPVRSGWIAVQRRELVQGVAFATKAIGIDPRFARAYDLMAALLHGVGRYDAALAAYDKAISIAPGDPQFHFNRYKVLVAAGRNDEALHEADVMLALQGPEMSESQVVTYDTLISTSLEPARAGRDARLHA